MLLDCLRLPREILCWICSSFILAFVFGYTIQSFRTGIWPWTDFAKFWEQDEYFWITAIGSLVALYLIVGLGACLIACWGRRRSSRQTRAYQLLDLEPNLSSPQSSSSSLSRVSLKEIV